MKVYIASSHNTSAKITQRLFFELQGASFEVFFPESIGVHALNAHEMERVDQICCEAIQNSDVLVAIYPFGLSVSVEIGRFLQLSLNENRNIPRKIIVLNTSRNNTKVYRKLMSEAMIVPHVDIIVKTIPELIYHLNRINSEFEKYKC